MVSTTMQAALTPPRSWTLCQEFGCTERAAASGPASRAASRLWLQTIRQDSVKMREVRSFLAAHRQGADLSRASDEMVVERLTHLLAEGRVHLHRGPAIDAALYGGSFEQTVREDAPVAFPVRPPQRVVTAGIAVGIAPQIESFLPEVHLPAQVAALRAAAESGKPFCPE